MMDLASKRLHSQYDKITGLASPVPSQCNSDNEDDACVKLRAVKFQQCPKPCRRLEPVSKKLRCPTPPVKQIAYSVEDDDDFDSESDSDSDSECDKVDSIHADRFRRSDSDSDDDSSEVFYCE